LFFDARGLGIEMAQRHFSFLRQSIDSDLNDAIIQSNSQQVVRAKKHSHPSSRFHKRMSPRSWLLTVLDHISFIWLLYALAVSNGCSNLSIADKCYKAN